MTRVTTYIILFWVVLFIVANALAAGPEGTLIEIKATILYSSAYAYKLDEQCSFPPHDEHACTRLTLALERGEIVGSYEPSPEFLDWLALRYGEITPGNNYFSVE